MYIYRKNIKQNINPDDEIKEFIQKGEFDSFIYIVPTRRKSRYLFRDFIDIAPYYTVPRLNIYTIGAFANKLFESYNSGKKEISSSLQFFFIRKTIRSIELEYFHRVKEFVSTGIIETMISIISRLKELGYSHHQFQKSIDEFSGYNKIKLEDVYNIYSKYQRYLDKLGLYEIGDVYINLEQLEQPKFNNYFRSNFPLAAKIVISGFDEFTYPELSLIEKISEVPELDLTLTLDFDESNSEIFENLFETHQKIISLGFESIESEYSEHNSDFQEMIRKNLFRSAEEGKKSLGNVNKFSGFNIREEVEVIAKVIKTKLGENPELELHRICIAMKDIGQYADLIRELFDVYGIPVNVTDRFFLKNSPVIISIISLLRLIVNDYYYKDIFKVLKSNYLEFEEIDSKNLYDVISSEKVIRGKKKIIEAIQSRIALLSDWDKANENEFSKRELISYSKALKDFGMLSSLLETIGRVSTASEFVFSLKELLSALKLHKNIFYLQPFNDDRKRFEVLSKDSIALDHFYQILDEMISVYSKLEMLDKASSFTEHYEYLLSSISGTRYNLKEKTGYGVQVTTPNEIRGLKFKYLFLPGLVNGVFPSPYRPLLFLEDKFIKDDRRKLLEERYLFYQALSAFTDKLYVSYPRSDEKKEFVISDFLKSLEKIITINPLDLDHFNNQIFTLNELYFNLDLLSDDEIEKLAEEQQKQADSIYKIRERISKRVKNRPGDEFAGFITKTELQQNLQKQNKEKYFSITELETFAKCPYKYFLSNVLDVYEEEEVEEDATQKEIGLLLHRILERFFSKLKNEKREFYAELESKKEMLFNELLSISKDEVEKIKTYNPYFFLVEEFFLGSEKVQSVFEAFLQHEYESRDKINPYEFEKYLQVELNAGKSNSIRLRGKIDRIDFDKQTKSVQVIDYKTGSYLPSKSDIAQNLSLQMPLYLKMCEKHLQDQFGKINIEDSIFLQIRKKSLGNEINQISLRKLASAPGRSELGNFLSQKLIEVKAMNENINLGNFNLTKVDKSQERVCRYCSYSAVCRIKFVDT
jgi:ATP-dependent helicase/nuclease subunit B